MAGANTQITNIAIKKTRAIKKEANPRQRTVVFITKPTTLIRTLTTKVEAKAVISNPPT